MARADLRGTERSGADLRTGFRLLACVTASALAFAMGCVEPTEFVSADLGTATRGGPEVLATAGDAAATVVEDSAEVEEGDIYRVLPGHRILNLNSHRGLQVIDFSDVSAPEIVGRLRLPGVPIEAYIRGDRAFILVTSHRTYRSVPYSQEAEAEDGSLALVVDLSDPTAPAIVDRALLPGRILVGRMVHGASRAALYVVTSAYRGWIGSDGNYTWEFRSHVWSFDIAAGELTPRSQLNLGGHVNAVQATPEALLVARVDTANWRRSLVSVVDISDPTGAMVEGDEALIDGSIRNQFAMDLRGPVLRVVANDRTAGTNRLYTFDISDLARFAAVDRIEFGDGQNLFASLFLENKAFFVTFLRIDPFHSFEIDDDGRAREVSEFEVSGWNDFFRAVFDERRLIGIGVDTEGGFTAAVSLYDITDLSNPEPLVTRAEIEGSHAWSEAHWDHRAFSVLEDSVDVAGPGGERETGLVLLPYSGWDADTGSSEQGVQIFTFSEESLTLRGAMEQGSAVRRSFQPEPGTDVTANLSTTTLSLFDTADPDAPDELSRLDLNPNYTRLLLFGDHAIRAKDTRDPWAWWFWHWGSTELPAATLETIDLTGDPDAAPAIAELEVPYESQLHAVGRHLVTSRIEPTGGKRVVDVYDLSDASNPHAIGSVEMPTESFSYYPCYAVSDVVANLSVSPCGFQHRLDDAIVLDEALVFVENVSMSEHIGVEQWCNEYPVASESCFDADGKSRSWIPGCTDYTGGLSCRTPEGGETSCHGRISRCSVSDTGVRICRAAEPGEVETVESCYERPIFDHWVQSRFRIVDLSTPTDPRAETVIELPRGDREATGLANGSDLWISFKRPVDGLALKPLARHYIQRIDLADPSAPDRGDAINVPGSLVAVDGNLVFTRDVQWAGAGTESSVHRLRLENAAASLEASRSFPVYAPREMLLDGAGQLVLSLSDAKGGIAVSLLDAYGDLGVSGRFVVDSWGQLRLALPGRAVLDVYGGQLILDTEDPALPFARSVIHNFSWNSQLSRLDRRLFIASGWPGILEVDLDGFDIELPEAPAP